VVQDFGRRRKQRAKITLDHFSLGIQLIRCGQNSPQVFCIGIVLLFCAYAAIELSLSSVWVQIVVGDTVVLLMTTSAYYWIWS
jgi:hypothetical protein